MIKIKKITNICYACPSQWEGYTFDDEPIYIRYRWGFLSVRIGIKGEGIMSAVGGKEIFYNTFGDQYDGFMDYETLKSNLSLSKIIELPNIEGE